MIEVTQVYSSISSFSSLQATSGCNHHPAYFLWEENDTSFFCGLCWLLKGYDDEIPGRLHAYKVLAENGNPESSPKFISHLQVAMGLKPPRKGQPLWKYRKEQEKRSKRSPGQFPVTSALWEMMGWQPPLAEPLFYKLSGMDERDILAKMGISSYNLQIRLLKGVRLALRYIRHDGTVKGSRAEARIRANAETPAVPNES